MPAAMQRVGRRPTTLQVQKIQKIRKFQDSWHVLLVVGLLEVRTITFSRDSSRKWTSQWLVGENLDWSWQGSLLCWRILGSVSEHHSLELGTIPHCRFTCFVKIRESATRRVILPMDFSLLSWWDTTYMLHIVLIYHGMKLLNTVCLSHLFCYWWVAGKACPMSDTFSPKFLLTKDSVWKFCV